MQYNTLIHLLFVSGAVMATPLSHESPASPLSNRQKMKVGYGEQIQTSDDVNHWVVWVEGKSACPATQTLTALNTSPCDQEFTLAGGTWKLANCNGLVFGGSRVLITELADRKT